MYIRKSNSGHDVVWNPEDINLGKLAISETLNIPIENINEEEFVSVTNEQAAQIRKKYQELIEPEEGSDA